MGKAVGSIHCADISSSFFFLRSFLVKALYCACPITSVVPISVIIWESFSFLSTFYSLNHLFHLPYSKLSSRVQPQLSPEKHSLRPQQPQQQQQHQSEAESIKSALGGSYNSIFASGPLAQYRAIVCGGLRRAGTANGSLNRKVELKSTGTGGSSVSIHHRRVQTRSDSTMMEHQEAVIDTHSADGSGTASPGADSGVFSSSTDGKYEVIQKDIGYSSDADMSDAIEVRLPPFLLLSLFYYAFIDWVTELLPLS